jgi:hypothetical protein
MKERRLLADRAMLEFRGRRQTNNFQSNLYESA